MQPVAADLKAKISRLNDNQAVWAVGYVGNDAAKAQGRAPAVLSREVRALPGFDSADVPVVAEGRVLGDDEDRKRAGIVARYALTLGADDDREEVRLAVAAAVAQALEPVPEKELITIMLIGGAVLLGLAVLGKLEITADGKIVLHKGLPGIEDAGKAVGGLVKAALGAS